jgi:hypothetical protein
MLGGEFARTREFEDLGVWLGARSDDADRYSRSVGGALAQLRCGQAPDRRVTPDDPKRMMFMPFIRSSPTGADDG